ncbi:hypothetical protein PSAB6_50101 [Paraburkholderia sabiae]|nr:hypothetical protein PSAB6_50101 [Paraburkholderia sabiae]
MRSQLTGLGHLQSFVWTPRRTFRRRFDTDVGLSAGVVSSPL